MPLKIVCTDCGWESEISTTGCSHTCKPEELSICAFCQRDFDDTCIPADCNGGYSNFLARAELLVPKKPCSYCPGGYMGGAIYC